MYDGDMSDVRHLVSGPFAVRHLGSGPFAVRPYLLWACPSPLLAILAYNEFISTIINSGYIMEYYLSSLDSRYDFTLLNDFFFFFQVLSPEWTSSLRFYYK